MPAFSPHRMLAEGHGLVNYSWRHKGRPCTIPDCVLPCWLCSDAEWMKTRALNTWLHGSCRNALTAGAWVLWRQAAAVPAPWGTWSPLLTGPGRHTLSWKEVSWIRCGSTAEGLHSICKTMSQTNHCRLHMFAGRSCLGRRTLVPLLGCHWNNRPDCVHRDEGEGSRDQRGQSDHGGEWCCWGLRFNSRTGKWKTIVQSVMKCFLNNYLMGGNYYTSQKI